MGVSVIYFSFRGDSSHGGLGLFYSANLYKTFADFFFFFFYYFLLLFSSWIYGKTYLPCLWLTDREITVPARAQISAGVTDSPLASFVLTLHSPTLAIGVKAVDVNIEQGWSSSKLLQMTLAAAMLALVQTLFCARVVFTQSRMGNIASARVSMMCSSDCWDHHDKTLGQWKGVEKDTEDWLKPCVSCILP